MRWRSLYALLICCLAAAPLSVTLTYTDNSHTVTTNPSVLAATTQAIAATQPAPKPPVVTAVTIIPAGKSLDGLKLVGVYDLAGVSHNLSSTLVDGGVGVACTIRNGRIVNTGVPISKPLFNVVNGGTLTLDSLTVTQPDLRDFVAAQWYGSLNV